MEPKFSMTSDSTEPDIKSCVAHWEFSGGGVSHKFSSGERAFAINRIIAAAYKEGLKDGRRDLAQAVMQTVKSVVPDTK